MRSNTQPRTRAPSTRWTKGLSTKDAEDFNQTLRNNRYVLGRLQQLLKEELEIVEREDATTAEFDNPNWVYRQAARVGEKSRIRKTLELLEFLD